jgi:hypothetical protein
MYELGTLSLTRPLERGVRWQAVTELLTLYGIISCLLGQSVCNADDLELSVGYSKGDQDFFIRDGVLQGPFGRSRFNVDVRWDAGEDCQMSARRIASSRLELTKAVASDDIPSDGCEFVERHVCRLTVELSGARAAA